jgi:hypothetical protein
VSQLQSSRPLKERVLTLDLRSLGLLRICYGILLLLDLAGRATDLRAHYTDWGIAPRQVVDQLASSWPSPCLHALSGGLTLQIILFALHGVAALALTLGIQVRWAGPICWLLLCSVHSRNPVICDGGDNYLRVVFFWCLFFALGLPLCTAAGAAPGPVANGRFCLPGATQLCLLVCRRSENRLRLERRQRCLLHAEHRPVGISASHWLLEKPTWMCFLTHFTLWVEIIAPLLLWVPGWPRLLAIAILGCMHLGFGLFMRLGLFPWIGIVSCWGMLPGLVWGRTPDSAPPPQHRRFWLLAYPLRWCYSGICSAWASSVLPTTFGTCR